MDVVTVEPIEDGPVTVPGPARGRVALQRIPAPPGVLFYRIASAPLEPGREPAPAPPAGLRL